MYAEVEGDNIIYLSGRIWEGDGPYVRSVIRPIINQPSKTSYIRVHSIGGDVFDGSIIFNEIKRASSNVVVDIEGIAASMMAIIALSGNKVRMAANAFLMIHAPSGETAGTAADHEETIGVLKEIESNFKTILSQKTGKTEEEVSAWLVGDNWFSAKQALEAGLIDEIIDPVLMDDFSAHTNMRLAASLFPDKDREQNHRKILNTNPDMKIEANALKALGLNGNPNDSEINSAIIALSEKVTTAESRATTAENALNALKAADKASVIDAAIKAGKFPASEKAQWEADYDANPDMTKRLIDRLPAKASLPNAEKPEEEEPTEGIPADRKNWTKDDWRKKDPAGMLALKKSNPAAYNALWNQ